MQAVVDEIVLGNVDPVKVKLISLLNVTFYSPIHTNILV